MRGARAAAEDARAQFDVFFDAHHRDLARLAYLLSGDQDAADDLTAEAFTEAWKRWEQVTGSDVPLAYVRRIVVNLAASRVRRLVRERRGWRLLGAVWSERTDGPDVAAGAQAGLRGAAALLRAQRAGDGRHAGHLGRHGEEPDLAGRRRTGHAARRAADRARRAGSDAMSARRPSGGYDGSGPGSAEGPMSAGAGHPESRPAESMSPTESMSAELGHATSGPAPDAEPTAWLTELLDSEARHYEPDTARIRTTLYENLDGAARGRRRRSLLGLRLAGIPAGIAAAALCGTVAVAVTATVESHPKAPTPTTAEGGGLPAASRDPSADGSAQPASHGSQTAVAGHPASPSASSPSGSGSASPDASASASAGPTLITAVGAVDPSSNASWAQENVNITLTEPVTSFQLTVKVSTSAGLSSTGDWTNYDISVFDVTVDTRSDGIVYTFQLKSGKTLQPGSAEFAVQFAHGAVHDPADDSYYASVITDKAHGSAQGVSQGNF
jgi:DNA-directed RNA polymerase specialized sigma24 family protein